MHLTRTIALAALLPLTPSACRAIPTGISEGQPESSPEDAS